MKDSALDTAAVQPPASHSTLATAMVADSGFGSYISAEVSSNYPLGIGAEVDPVSGENFMGLIL